VRVHPLGRIRASASAREEPGVFARVWNRIKRWPLRILSWSWSLLVDEVFNNVYLVGAAVWAFFRALGVTVQTGQTGLRFTLGRAGQQLEPGFHWMVPFVQRARVVPTRSRTLDLEDQRVATRDGLVVVASATLVWRIENVAKSIIEVDHLLKAMTDWLSVAAARVLSGAARADLDLRAEESESPELDRRLEAELTELLAPWGVRVERAGFPTIAPSPRTAALLQTRERVRTRRRAHRMLGGDSVALLFSGARPALPVRRAKVAAERERASRMARRLQIEQQALELAQELRERAKIQRRQAPGGLGPRPGPLNKKAPPIAKYDA